MPMVTPKYKVLLEPDNGNVHRWVMVAAWQIRHAGGDEDEAVEEIKACEGMLREGRKFQPREVENAVARVYDFEPGSKVTRAMVRKHTQPVKMLDAVVSKWKDASLNSFREKSPYPEPRHLTAEMMVDLLWPNGGKICMGRWSPWEMPGERQRLQAGTQEREYWRGREHEMPYIVPSRAVALTGKTQDGRTSRRCLEMFPKRDYLVAEFDDGAAYDDQAKRIAELASARNPASPLVLVCKSGGKSLHAWFRAPDSEEDCLKVYNRIVGLGGDPAGRNRCQLFRTPGGWRVLPYGFWETETEVICELQGIRQEVVFFNHTQAIKENGY